MKKRLMSLALALALCLGLTVPAFAEGEDTSPDLYTYISSASGAEYPYVDAERNFKLRKLNQNNAYGESTDVSDVFLVVPAHEYFYVCLANLAKGEEDYIKLIAYTDHDGDSVYDVRLFAPGKNAEGDVEVTALPIPENGVYEEGPAVSIANAGKIPGFEQFGDGDYRFSAASLYKVFGNNTLLSFYLGEDNEYLGSVWLYAGAFDDVPGVGWYSEPVAWAVDKGITKGVSETEFAPGDDCTQLQILTFLSRAAGNTNTGSNWSMEQMMVIKWAKEKGMIGDSFNGNDPCTRATAVNYIWQAFDKPAAAAASGFKDMEGYEDYAQAVDWAKEKEIAKGSDGEFGPGDVCSRAEIATFLWRAYHNET